MLIKLKTNTKENITFEEQTDKRSLLIVKFLRNY